MGGMVKLTNPAVVPPVPVPVPVPGLGKVRELACSKLDETNAQAR
jgi:hypothetical protein